MDLLANLPNSVLAVVDLALLLETLTLNGDMRLLNADKQCLE